MPDRKPTRLQGFDYTRDKLYFVTSCVQDRVCCLGNIVDGKMQLNDYGKICETQWHWLAQQYPYVALHAFVVMPNHIHGIIEIDSLKTHVGNGRDHSLHGAKKIKSLSELMGAYKTTTSKQIRAAGLTSFKWQKSFHDHIIRRGDSFETISNYIENNTAKWLDDRFYEIS